MYDFWFTLGSAVMDAGIFTNIQTAIKNSNTPPFTLLTSRRIVEVGGKGFDKTNTKTAGLLSSVMPDFATDTIRQLIRSYIQGNKNAPPVSIYTAGKFSQLLAIKWIDSVKQIDFPKIMTLANTAFVKAAKGATAGALPPNFPAIIGLCLLDNAVATLIATSIPGTADGATLAAFMLEFGISKDAASPERMILTSYVTDQANFGLASGTLQQGDSTPWQDLCGDQYFFWDTQNERAVL